MGWSAPIKTKANGYEGLIYNYNSSAVNPILGVGSGKIPLSGVRVEITTLKDDWIPTYDSTGIINNNNPINMYKTDGDDDNAFIKFEYITNDVGKFYFRSEDENFEIKISKTEFVESKAEKKFIIKSNEVIK